MVPPSRVGVDTKALFITFSIWGTYYLLDSLNDIHIWQVSAQLIHGNIYEILT